MNAADLFQGALTPMVQRTILQTYSFTPPIDLDAIVMLGGPGGSGACVINGDADDADGFGRNHATGANAGGVVMQRVRFRAGYTYTFTIHPGGIAVGATSNPGDDLSHVYQGNAGQGDVTLTSTAPGWVDMVAKAGLGGVGWRQQSNAGADGTDHDYQTQTWGSGADLILPGGYGGKILLSVDQNNNLERGLATGGGAPNLAGFSSEELAGGTAELSDAASQAIIATSGSGAMGKGGDAERDAGGSDEMVSGAGSATEPGEDIVSTDTQIGTSGRSLPFAPSTLIPINGRGGAPALRTGANTDNGEDGEDGASGGAVITNSTATSVAQLLAGTSGIFAGGPAAACGNPYGANQPRPVGGDAGLGGGGGGSVQSPWNNKNSAQTAMSGNGGDGWAMIFITSNFGRTKA